MERPTLVRSAEGDEVADRAAGSKAVTTRVLVVSGSERRGSLNARLASLAAQVAAAQGAQVRRLDLRALALPLYDGDIEAAGLPGGALELRAQLANHDALLVATPEYNAFVPPLLVNAFAWASRVPADGELPSGLAAMAGKVAGLASASPGAFGGLRALVALRGLLGQVLGMVVVPQQQAVPLAHQAFDDEGRLREPRLQQGLEAMVRATLSTAGALRAAR